MAGASAISSGRRISRSVFRNGSDDIGISYSPNSPQKSMTLRSRLQNTSLFVIASVAKQSRMLQRLAQDDAAIDLALPLRIIDRPVTAPCVPGNQTGRTFGCI